MSVKAGREAFDRGNKDQALLEFYEALNHDFNDAQALFYAGTLLMEKGCNGLAANIFSRALQCKPNNADALTNLGGAYKKEEDWKGAEEIWRMAYDVFESQGDREGMAGILSNIATLYVHMGEMDEAIRIFDAALQIQPGQIDALANRSMAYLWSGRWEEGWGDYDHHMSLGTRNRRPYMVNGQTIPEWDGTPGRKPVIYGEQGLGDEILFASMFPDVQKLCPDAVLDCHPRLEKTFRRSFGPRCYGTRKTDKIGDWFAKEMPDCALAIGSLGKFFRTRTEDFPGAPYIKPDPELLLQFLGQRRGKPRIGISWAGGSKKTGKSVRSIPLGEFVPLFKAVDAEWFSLQYTKPSGEEIDNLEMETGVHVRHFPKLIQIDDYDRTIAFVASLDLVITCCTSILHAAGSVGTPVWILTPYESAWRESGNDGKRGPNMPWYSSARLFHRAKEETTWAPTIERVRSELADYRFLQGPEQAAAQ